MRLAVHCPYCKRPMAASAAFAGQMVACPNCRGEFLFTPPGMTPPPANPAAEPPSPPPMSLQRTDADPPLRQPRAASAAPEPLSGTTYTIPAPPVQAAAPAAQAAVATPAGASGIKAPPLPATPPPQTARLKTAASPSPADVAAADGKLPTLQLADAENAEAKADGTSQGIPLWLAVAAVAASTIFSAILLLTDFEGTQTTAARAAAARREIVQFYGTDAARLAPYQVLLREAQQAHSRGDRRLEKQKYREVMALLRAEGRTQYDGLTGTPSGDADLARLLAVLLAE